MTAFRVLLAFSSVVQPLHDISPARNFALNIDRTIYVTATYIIFRKESLGKSLQSGQKCCIFAPAIEGTALGALHGSSLTTEAGDK